MGKKRDRDSGGTVALQEAALPTPVFDPVEIKRIVEEEGYRSGFYRMVVNDPGVQIRPGVTVPAIESGSSLPIIEFTDNDGKIRVAGITVMADRHIHKLRCPGSINNTELCNHEWWPEQPYLSGQAAVYLHDHFEIANRHTDSHYCPACRKAGRPLTKGVRVRIGDSMFGEVAPGRTVRPIFFLRAQDRAAFDIVTDPGRKPVDQFDRVERKDGSVEQRFAGQHGGPLERTIMAGNRVIAKVKWGQYVSLEWLGEDADHLGDPVPVQAEDAQRVKAAWKKLESIEKRITANNEKLQKADADKREELEAKAAELAEEKTKTFAEVSALMTEGA